jgi:hypothetical protein
MLVMKQSATWSGFAVVSYVIWGIVHFQAAYAGYQHDFSLPLSMAQGGVLQDAWNLAFFAIFASAMAIVFNWQNNRWGYWINLGVVGMAEMGFIFYVLVPGHIPLWPGLLGPVFWLSGLAFSSLSLPPAGEFIECSLNLD